MTEDERHLLRDLLTRTRFRTIFWRIIKPHTLGTFLGCGIFSLIIMIIGIFDRPMESHWDDAHPLKALGELLLIFLGGTLLMAVFSLPVVWFFNVVATIDEFRQERKPIKQALTADEAREIECEVLSVSAIVKPPSIFTISRKVVELGFMFDLGGGDLLYLSCEALRNCLDHSSLPGRRVTLTAIPFIGKIITLNVGGDPPERGDSLTREEVLLTFSRECHLYHLPEPLSYFINQDLYDDDNRERCAVAETII